MRELIAKAASEGNITLGTKSVIKGIKNSEIEKVIYATNIPQHILNNLKYYSKHFSIEIESFGNDSRHLGELCGKPFSVLVIGIKSTKKHRKK
ncbi:MAG: hypothetical protein DRP03_03625 [Candidatus Aenigmatarchaeota archaeon]|nr:MAG: hypothetical protein DRP03_03625 [Candidatus Aenigmarchaeota archaeon]